MLGSSPFLVVGVLKTEDAGLELQRARQRQGLDPGHDVPGPHGREVREQRHLPGEVGVRDGAAHGPHPGDPRQAQEVRPEGQGSALGVGHDGAVQVLRHVHARVHGLSRHRGLAHARRGRHRRLEHHERRRRGADEGDRDQDGARGEAALHPRPVPPRDAARDGRGRPRSASRISLGDLRRVPEARLHGFRRRPRGVASRRGDHDRRSWGSSVFSPGGSRPGRRRGWIRSWR